MSWLRKKSLPEKAANPLARVDTQTLARSGLTAGATVVALSVVSAATSAWRRRTESA